MLLKKSAMLAAVLALISAPFAHATLLTHNQTKLYSTVALDNGACAGGKGKITEPGKDLPVGDFEVRYICKFASKCGATILVGTLDEMKVCQGTKIGHAVLDTGSVTLDEDVRNDAPGQYNITGKKGSNELTIAAN
jgi:hypothetical protein